MQSKSDCVKIPLQFCLLKITKLYLAFKTLYKAKNQWNTVFKILVFQNINQFIYSNEVGPFDNISELVLLQGSVFPTTASICNNNNSSLLCAQRHLMKCPLCKQPIYFFFFISILRVCFPFNSFLKSPTQSHLDSQGTPSLASQNGILVLVHAS